MTSIRIVPAQTDDRTVSLSASPEPAALTVEQVLGHVALLQRILSVVMKEGEHFGRIPGCGDKPTLLEAGAEILCLLFRLAPEYDVQERQLEGGHREYRVAVTLTSITTQITIGQGVGSCSTMEGKFRLRAGPSEIIDHLLPRLHRGILQEDPARTQELIGGHWSSMKKIEGRGRKVARGGEKSETEGLADNCNTVLKMAKKRAFVDAVLTTTAASDIFTQDLDDLGADDVREASGSPALDFRHTAVHFGKNRGLTLADLSPQQIHWYEAEWMPKKEAEGLRCKGDETLVDGLKAYRVWRETEKATVAVETTKTGRASGAGHAFPPI